MRLGVGYDDPPESARALAAARDLAKRYGPIQRLIHGSVSGYLLGHASCSLLVLPRVGQDKNAASQG
jgi:nucleotide-binding universal stress UspA family protein